MPKSTPRVTTCAHSLKLLADFWVLRIVETLVSGKQRYCEIQRAVGNVNPTTLTKKLNNLEEAGLIKRLPETNTASVFYELTTLGQGAVPVIDAIKSFSNKLEKSHK